MRFLLLLVPAIVLAQTAPPAKAPAKAPAAPTKAPATGAAHPAVRPATKAATKAAPKPAAKPAEPALTTDEQKTIYSIGLSIYRSLSAFNLSPADLDLVKRAITDAAANKPEVSLDEWGPKIQTLGQARIKASSEAYLVKAAAEPGAVKTESGLIYKELRPGTGGSPKATDTVKVNYRGTLVSGTEFDSSYKRGEPAQFPLNGVIACWTEGVQKMKVGGKSQLVCPSSLAYGDRGNPSIPGGSTLIFEVELLEIAPPKQP
ncbi:MAG: FKBP-type peptidyl-prolyl cis-trans isomerase [Acidobacteria bacterium]|nr:FKBP-type peptidyl-prolyl cis-trans isomerase [Acidobacteriota bacterium]